MQQVKFAQKRALNKIADFSVELLKNTMTSQNNVIISPVSIINPPYLYNTSDTLLKYAPSDSLIV